MVEEAVFHIENGEDINSCNTIGQTALHLASENGHLETVKFLIESKADIEAKDNLFGKTALHLASENGHLETVKFLIENKANINPKDDNGNTALEVVKFLITNGAKSGKPFPRKPNQNCNIS